MTIALNGCNSHAAPDAARDFLPCERPSEHNRGAGDKRYAEQALRAGEAPAQKGCTASTDLRNVSTTKRYGGGVTANRDSPPTRSTVPVMPQRGTLKAHPSDYLAPDAQWPDGALEHDAPPAAHLARAVARRLTETLTQRELSLRAAADTTGASAHALFNITHGLTWCDLPTLARLERGLRIQLWGTEHRH